MIFKSRCILFIGFFLLTGCSFFSFYHYEEYKYARFEKAFRDYKLTVLVDCNFNKQKDSVICSEPYTFYIFVNFGKYKYVPNLKDVKIAAKGEEENLFLNKNLEKEKHSDRNTWYFTKEGLRLPHNDLVIEFTLFYEKNGEKIEKQHKLNRKILIKKEKRNVFVSRIGSV